jgi:predicted small integral membrane protein
VGAAVGVVLNTLNLGWNAIFVTAKINHTVVVLVTAALVAGGDVTVVVTPRALLLRLQQRRVARAFVQVVTRDFDNVHGDPLKWVWF